MFIRDFCDLVLITCDSIIYNFGFFMLVIYCYFVSLDLPTFFVTSNSGTACREYCNRPFKNIEDMNKTILQNIEESIRPKDILYFLGDLTSKESDSLGRFFFFFFK